jgi:predicted AAA+ superfamily ATPase
MYQRTLSSALERFATLYPLLGITGPRQSGKTTLARLTFPHLPYVSLENPDIRAQAIQDPRGFLERYHNGAIFDEVQHAPELFSYLQGIVDESPQKGRFILTGSQNFTLSEKIIQSLAGRIGMMTLLPLSLEELGPENNPTDTIFKGGYPAIYQNDIHPMEFYPSYIQTYIERDVRQLKNIGNLGTFQTFLKLCAGRVGQTINLSSLAQDCGISQPTARQWLTILESSYLIFLLQPFYKNFSKRQIKMPKLYFYDTGLACALLGLEKGSQLETHYLKGALYENLVILEALKTRLNQGKPHHLYYWRDQSGHEVDLIAEWGGNTHGIEIKSSSTFQPDFIKNLKFIQNLSSSITGHLVYSGTQEGTYAGISLVPLKKFTPYAIELTS